MLGSPNSMFAASRIANCVLLGCLEGTHWNLLDSFLGEERWGGGQDSRIRRIPSMTFCSSAADEHLNAVFSARPQVIHCT